MAAVVGGAAQDSRAGGWMALHPSLMKRTEVGAARIGGSIYVIGGFTADSRTTAAVERYSIAGDSWTRVRDMPRPLNHAAAVAYRGDLYVVGGYTSATGLTQESRALYRYRPGKDRWSRLPDAPSARGALAAGVLGHRLYAVGGARGGRALRTLEVFDFETRRWHSAPKMPTAREHLAAAVSGGRLYALAGRAAGKGNFRVAERYQPKRRRWEELSPMGTARGGIAAATARGRVAVFGGERSEGTIPETERFDPSARDWSYMPDMLTPRHGLGGVSFGRRLYAIEGGPQPGFAFSDAIEAYDLP
ncbi:MAG TPA: kelch repeat-containing protein [Thermoleophilaceae bacterium]